ncbi:hypothetical protein J6590_049390 [Homalodisca vitripennis]|nr:hypothetical protein J6590_049390 [Homalodisca vitripennis]
MMSASQQSVYNTSWVRTVPVSSAATIYNLLHVMSGKGDFLASVKVKDSRNCLGSPGNHSVGKEVMKSASQQSVYNTSWVRTVPFSSAATIYNLLHVMSGKGDFLASVQVKDSRNCLGSPGNHSFSSKLYLFV